MARDSFSIRWGGMTRTSVGVVLEGVFLPAPLRGRGSGDRHTSGNGCDGGTRILLRWQQPGRPGNTWAAPLAWLAWLTLTSAAVFSGGAAALGGSTVALAGVSLIGTWATRWDQRTLLQFLREALEAHIIVLDWTEQERVMEQTKDTQHTHETVTHEHPHTHPGGETHTHTHTHQLVQHEHAAGTTPHQHQQAQEEAPDPTHTQTGHPHPHGETR